MRARALLAGVVGMLLLAIAFPAAAKPPIAKAHISGPGLGEGLRISGPATEGMWSGIDVAGGRADVMAGSIAELGLTALELGPRYVVSYRFDVGRSAPRIVRQELYPYAKGGPVTYTPPGQHLTGPAGMTITAGWYQSPLDFFAYLVDHGLPEANPVGPVASGEPAGTAQGARKAPWAGIVVVLVGIAGLSLAALAVRRRVVVVARVNR